MLKIGIRENSRKPVYVCGHCRLQYITPRWKTEAELRDYYRSEYREHHEVRLGVRMSPEERHVYQSAFMEETSRVMAEEVPLGGSLLEIGCSAGGLLTHLKDKYELYGAEWNQDDAAYVRDTMGIPCEEGLLDDIYPGKTFNVVTAIQVFEHQPDPIAFLRSVKNKLIGGGVLYMELPHANDPLSAIYQIQEYQDFFYRDVHLTYWLPHQLHWFVDSAGLDGRVMPAQRYGLLNHLHWLSERKPMDNAMDARSILSPVNPSHPMAGVFNRLLMKLDVEYRLALKGLWSSDAIILIARRMEI